MAIRRDQPRRDDDDDLQQPRHEMVQGSLEHASGEVDEAHAGLVRGADGEATDVDEAELERQAGAAAPTRGAAASPGAPTRSGPGRFLAFLRASWAELQRVQWPDRRQVGQGTAVTLGFVVVAGAYLGVADEVATRIVDLIL